LKLLTVPGHRRWNPWQIRIGHIRLCVDFRRLNSVTPNKKSSIPLLDNILEKEVLSKLDLSKGFHQVVLEEDSKHITTLVYSFGKFRFWRMPFGLRNARSPAVFQLHMERVLKYCSEFSSVYIDLLVYSNN